MIPFDEIVADVVAGGVRLDGPHNDMLDPMPFDRRRLGRFPRLYGTREAAEVLGVARPNLKDVVGIRECAYPGGRVVATPLYLADAIDVLAEERQSRPQYRSAQLAKQERAAHG